MYTLCYLSYNNKIICYLNDQFIGQGLIENDFIVIKNNEKCLVFHCVKFKPCYDCNNKMCCKRDRTVHFQSMSLPMIMRNNKLECQTCGIVYDSNEETKLTSQIKDTNSFILYEKRNVGESCLNFYCQVNGNHIGDGYLDQDDVILINDQEDNYRFFHENCTPFIIKNNEIAGIGALMHIIKHNQKEKTNYLLKLILLNEPFIQIRKKDEFKHDILFSNERLSKLYISYRGDWDDSNVLIPSFLTLECQTCKEIIPMNLY